MPYEAVELVAGSEESELHQRRFIQREPTVSNRFEVGLEHVLLLCELKLAPVQLLYFYFYVLVHNLHRRFEALPLKRCPQRGMPVHDLLPTLLKGRGV